MSNQLEVRNVAYNALLTYVAEQKKRSFAKWKDVYVRKEGAQTIMVSTPYTSIHLTFGPKDLLYPVDGYTRSIAYKNLPGIGSLFNQAWLYDKQASRALVEVMAPYLLADLDDTMSDLPRNDPRRFAGLGGLKAIQGKSKRKPWWQVW